MSNKSLLTEHSEKQRKSLGSISEFSFIKTHSVLIPQTSSQPFLSASTSIIKSGYYTISSSWLHRFHCVESEKLPAWWWWLRLWRRGWKQKETKSENTGPKKQTKTRPFCIKKKKNQRPPLSYQKSWKVYPNRKTYMNSRKVKYKWLVNIWSKFIMDNKIYNSNFFSTCKAKISSNDNNLHVDKKVQMDIIFLDTNLIICVYQEH